VVAVKVERNPEWTAMVLVRLELLTPEAVAVVEGSHSKHQRLVGRVVRV
jgi:hypothetical protein